MGLTTVHTVGISVRSGWFLDCAWPTLSGEGALWADKRWLALPAATDSIHAQSIEEGFSRSHIPGRGHRGLNITGTCKSICREGNNILDEV